MSKIVFDSKHRYSIHGHSVYFFKPCHAFFSWQPSCRHDRCLQSCSCMQSTHHREVFSFKCRNKVSIIPRCQWAKYLWLQNTFGCFMLKFSSTNLMWNIFSPLPQSKCEGLYESQGGWFVCVCQNSFKMHYSQKVQWSIVFIIIIIIKSSCSIWPW